MKEILMKAYLTKVGSKYNVTIRDDEGRTINALKVDPFRRMQVQELASLLKLQYEECSSLLESITEGTIEWVPPQPNTNFTVSVRGLYDLIPQAVSITSDNSVHALLDTLIKVPKECGPEPLIFWKDIERLAVLDIDYHGIPLKDRPSNVEISRLINSVLPRPFAAHASHGQGAKLYYANNSDIAANELAAVASFWWREKDNRATYEIKKETRHPLGMRLSDQSSCGPVHIATSDINMSAVSKWLGRTADPDQIAEVLLSRGWQAGKMLPHANCLIDPNHVSHSDSVYIGDIGIHCNSCESRGLCYPGERKPGFIPYTRFINGVDGRLARMLKHFVHWEHARHSLLYLFPGTSEKLLQLAYSAAMKLTHGTEDTRIPSVFSAPKIIRQNGNWFFNSESGKREALKINMSAPIIATLPGLLVPYQGKQGQQWKADAAVLAEFRNGGNDLASYGYADLYPVHGCRIWGEYLPYQTNETPLLTHSNSIPEQHRPRYIPSNKRSSLEGAWNVLEGLMPGLNREYIKLLLIGKGLIEGGGQKAVLAVTVNGPSGSGKTLHAAIASGIVGQQLQEMTWTKDTERLRQQAVEGAMNADLITLDEVFKTAQREHMNGREAVDPVLKMTVDSMSHKMYFGPVKLAKVFVLVLTDIGMPEEVSADDQLGRRMIFVQLTRRLDWIKSCESAGLNHPNEIRIRREWADACDVILSDVVDSFFKDSIPNWTDSARSLGFVPLEDALEFADKTDTLIEFFRACVNTPETPGQKYAYSEGWRLITRDGADALSEMWQEVCDSGSVGWNGSRKVQEKDWLRTLLSNNVSLNDTENAIQCDIKSWRMSNLFVRFRQGGTFEHPSRGTSGILLTPRGSLL